MRGQRTPLAAQSLEHAGCALKRQPIHQCADLDALARAKINVSISRKGDWDNAHGRFFATLKAKLPLTVFPRHALAWIATFDSIEWVYNRQ